MDKGFGLGLKNVGLPEMGRGEKIGLGLELIVTGLRFCCGGWGTWGLGRLNPCGLGLELIITGIGFCCVGGWGTWGLGGLNPCGLGLIVTGLKFCWTGLGRLNPCTSFVSTNIGTKAPD